MTDINSLNVTVVEVDDELTANVADDSLVAKVAEDKLTVTSKSVFATINRGIGYVYAGVYNIIKDVLLLTRRKTKSGDFRITKDGSYRIISREVQ